MLKVGGWNTAQALDVPGDTAVTATTLPQRPDHGEMRLIATGFAESAMAVLSWAAGDACRIVNLRQTNGRA